MRKMPMQPCDRQRERGLGVLVLGGGRTADCSGFRRMAPLRLRESGGKVRSGTIKAGTHYRTFAQLFFRLTV